MFIVLEDSQFLVLSNVNCFAYLGPEGRTVKEIWIRLMDARINQRTGHELTSRRIVMGEVASNENVGGISRWERRHDFCSTCLFHAAEEKS
jgi:hypothetical protein